jgi:hypothetical protein
MCEQMANIGSEIERTIKWREKNKPDYSRRAFIRALELLDLTIGDTRHRGRLREVCRVREALVDRFLCNNEYNTTDQLWRRYFLHFAVAARRERCGRQVQ